MQKEVKFTDFIKQVENLDFELNAQNGQIWKKSYVEPWWDYKQVVINIVMYNNIDIYKCYDNFREIYLKYNLLVKFISLNISFWVKDGDNYHQYRFLSLNRFLNKETLEGPVDPDIYELIPYNEMPYSWKEL